MGQKGKKIKENEHGCPETGSEMYLYMGKVL